MLDSFVIPPDFARRNDEAFEAVMHGEKPDIVPVLLMVDSVLIMEIAGITADEYFLDYEAQWQALARTYRRFGGATPIMPFYYPCVEASALGRVEAHWGQRSAPMTKPFISGQADVDRLRPPRLGEDGLMGHVVKCTEHFLNRSQETGLPVTLDYGSMGPNDIAALMMGPEEMFLASKTKPKMLHRLLRIITETCIDWINWRIERFGGPMTVLDLGDDYSAYYSPDAFDEFVVPYTGAIMETFPDAYNMWHSDGDFTPKNLHKVNDLHIDMFNAFTPNLDIALVREMLGPDIVLAGNVHPIRVMVFGTPDDVLRESKRCIEAAGRDGHFVLCPGGGVGGGTRLENIDAMIQAALEYSYLMCET